MIRFLFELNLFYLQVIALTEELLATARQNEISVSDIGRSASESLSFSQAKGSSEKKMVPFHFCFYTFLFHLIISITSFYGETVCQKNI